MTTVGGGKAFDSPVEVGNGAGTHVHCCYWEYSKALALVRYSFPRLLNPVKGTNMSTLLSTPRQVTIPPSYLDIGMGGHFEGCRKADAQKFCADVYGCPTNLQKIFTSSASMAYGFWN